jgi:hypothetical protein
VSLLADTTPLRTPDFRRLWFSCVVTVVLLIIASCGLAAASLLL